MIVANLVHYAAWRLDAVRNARLGWVHISPERARQLRLEARGLIREAVARGVDVRDAFGIMGAGA